MRRVTLRHQDLTIPEMYVHTYDSLIIAKDGIIDAVLPDKDIESVWRRGFNLTVDGRRLFDIEELFQEVDRQNKLGE